MSIRVNFHTAIKEHNFKMSHQKSNLSPWHQGELFWQKRAGVEERMYSIGQRVIRSFMPQQHREFFQNLPLIVVGHEDSEGHPQASILFGEPGFIQSPNPQRLKISIQNGSSLMLRQPQPDKSLIALLGIDFKTRRRNRVNGLVADWSNSSFTVDVQHSFGNCNQYITERQIIGYPEQRQTQVSQFSDWREDLILLIENTNTFFIASSSRGLSDTEKIGMDVSHRGGPRGFIRFDSQQRLLVPDYSGNNFFNTLGNIRINPRVGLLFPDFKRGIFLHISAEAETIDKQNRNAPPENNPNRFLRFKMIHGWLMEGISPYLWDC